MLTEIAIKAAKPRHKPYKSSDGRGLYLLVEPNGGRGWRFRYRFEGREKMLSLGTYPDVPLRLARERSEDLRRLVASGVDPSAGRKAEKKASTHTLIGIAEEFFKQQAKRLDPGTVQRDRDRLEDFVIPFLGKRPISRITAPELLTCLQRIEARGRLETARRTRSIFGRVARYAIATGRAERDVSADLRGAIANPVETHYASITDPAKVGALLRAIDGFQGQISTTAALKLAPLVFVRPGELRAARWFEFDLEGREPTWRIPAARMKMGTEHVVPLARQAVAILKDLRAQSGNRELLFPSLRAASRPISNNTLNAALRRLGYTTDEQTPHGFRSTASTLLNEQGYHPDLIELQLAHQERNAVRAAYNKAQRLTERRQMMQAWADYLERLKAAQ
jgi:integrase